MKKIDCRTHIINSLIEKYKFKNYLEIGVRHPHQNFNDINIVTNARIARNRNIKTVLRKKGKT